MKKNAVMRKLPKPDDKHGIMEFIKSLMGKGYSLRAAKRRYRSLGSKHPLHHHHFGTFSPMKPIN
jgi:hypothetical protein